MKAVKANVPEELWERVYLEYGELMEAESPM